MLAPKKSKESKLARSYPASAREDLWSYGNKRTKLAEIGSEVNKQKLTEEEKQKGREF
ncbi:unnamed protein product [Acanthoscelides obtectus]|uniref:Uncharacterized protein n=1 Tax=Acanthoscelides obtectus TaxID=200917 RepID=A0A9P0JMV8_ACAOB|nr:unnamed protein product [Acanthoscelides obtectus]CAK1665838.1 hypothetical protein AOBTE_LOCUS24996 [Acanthoscelides obtectus]